MRIHPQPPTALRSPDFHVERAIHLSGVFRIDVSAEGQPTQAGVPVDANLVVIALLRQMLQSQEKQNQLLEQLVQQNMQAQKQRTSELQQWKDANPRLAKSCRELPRPFKSPNRISANVDVGGGGQRRRIDGWRFHAQRVVDRFGQGLRISWRLASASSIVRRQCDSVAEC